MKRTMRNLLCLGLPLLATGCLGCGGTGRFDIELALDHQAFQAATGTIPSVEVNLVGVNASEYHVWNAYPVSKYWRPDDPQRVTAVQQGYAAVVQFGEQPPFRQILYRNQLVWRQWKSKAATYLFVLSNYPWAAEDRPGDADARRVILPLAKRRWRGYFWGRRLIRLLVTPSGLQTLTPPKPE